MEERYRYFLGIGVLLSSLLILSGMAWSYISISNVSSVDVTPSGFAIMWETTEYATPGIRIFSDDTGAEDMTSHLELIPFPLIGGDPNIVGGYEKEEYMSELFNHAKSLGHMKIRVERCLPETTYYYQIYAQGVGEETIHWPATAPLPYVITTKENSFITDSKQILITIVDPRNIIDPLGWMVAAFSNETLYGVSAFFGDGAAENQAYIDLNNLFFQDGRNWTPTGSHEILLEIRGEEKITYETLTLDYSNNFSTSSVHPYNIEMIFCTEYYMDFDNDTYGVDSNSMCLDAPEGYYRATRGGDCDDTNPTIYAGAPELCDGKDTDCDGNIPDSEYDFDTDGIMGCEGDCNDGDIEIFPGSMEICDGKDNDCVNGPDRDMNGDDVCRAALVIVNDMDMDYTKILRSPQHVEWITFYGHSNRQYQIYVERKGDWGGCTLEAGLYSMDGNMIDCDIVSVPDPNTTGVEVFTIDPACIEDSSYYDIKFYYECTLSRSRRSFGDDIERMFSIIKITDGHIGQTGTLFGYVADIRDHFGIKGARVIVENHLSEGSIFVMDTVSADNGLYFLFDILPLAGGVYEVYASAPGYFDSPKISVSISEESLTRLRFDLLPNPADITPQNPLGKYDFDESDEANLLNASSGRDKYFILSLFTGMNIFACPCAPLAYDSSCLVQGIYNTLEEDANYNLSGIYIELQRYNDSSGSPQRCFIDGNSIVDGDGNSIVNGDIFPLQAGEVYIIYLKLDADTGSDYITLPLPCGDFITSDTGTAYDLTTGLNMVGFPKIPGDTSSIDVLSNLDLYGKIRSIIRYQPQDGCFSNSYPFFGATSGRQFRIIEDRGYGICLDEPVSWMP